MKNLDYDIATLRKKLCFNILTNTDINQTNSLKCIWLFVFKQVKQFCEPVMTLHE